MIVIATTVPEAQIWLEDIFSQYAPKDSYCLVDSDQARFATTAVSWFPDLDVLEKLPKLKLIHSMAAGVEHLNLERIGTRYKVCRVVDELHQKGMFDYLQWGVLYYQRFFDQAFAQKQQQCWQQYLQRDHSAVKIGVMGLGQMGGYIAKQFTTLGYQVAGWSRSLKQIGQVKCYAGREDLNEFLGQAEILINLLPLTESNQGILSKDLFDRLPEQACIINCGRGQHLVQQDLIDYLDSGRLRGAILDVFTQEPLAENHPFWRHEKVVITPHIASHAPSSIVVNQIIENDRRIIQNMELLNQVDTLKGY